MLISRCLDISTISRTLDHPCDGHLTSDPVLGGVHGVGGEPGPDPCLYYYAFSKLQRLKDKRYSEYDTFKLVIHTQNHTKSFSMFLLTRNSSLQTHDTLNNVIVYTVYMIHDERKGCLNKKRMECRISNSFMLVVYVSWPAWW